MSKDDDAWIPGRVDHDWIESRAVPLPPALAAIEVAAEPEGIPIVSRDAGRVLSVLVTIDPDQSRTTLARGWWREAGIADERITVVSRPALEAFAAAEPALAGPFDLAFIDALKQEYVDYVEALIPRLAAHALVVADNVLWSGRVSGARPSTGDERTEALRTFDTAMLADPRFHATILPIGDGLLIASLRG